MGDNVLHGLMKEASDFMTELYEKVDDHINSNGEEIKFIMIPRQKFTIIAMAMSVTKDGVDFIQNILTGRLGFNYKGINTVIKSKDVQTIVIVTKNSLPDALYSDSEKT